MDQQITGDNPWIRDITATLEQNERRTFKHALA
jgi:hypothetical protein